MGNRGVLSSLGAGLSLVIAGVIVLVIVSGIVAFRGWPGMRSDGSSEAVRLASVVAAPEKTAEPVVLDGGTRARRSAAGDAPARGARRRAKQGGRSAGDRRGAPRGSRRAGDGSRDARSGGGGDAGGGRSGAGSGPGADSQTASPRRPDPVQRALEGVDRTAGNLTAPKPEGSSPVDVPQVVQDTTQTADEVVQDTKDTVTGATGGAVELP